ncbi:MAG: hypothetical protein ACM3PP_04330 [Candidatus Saccharibacteria bacterium]
MRKSGLLLVIILVILLIVAGTMFAANKDMKYANNFSFIKVQNPLSGNNQVFNLNKMACPDVGKPFVDKDFGTIITRATVVQGFTGRHEYSRFDPYNANQSMILLDPSDGFKVYRTNKYPYNSSANFVRSVPLEEPRWDPKNPEIIWGTQDFAIKQVNVKSGKITVIKDFSRNKKIASLVKQNVYRITMSDEGESSSDKRFWAFFIQGNERKDYKQQYIFTWDRSQDRIIGVTALKNNETELDWVSMSPKGNWVLIGGLDNNGGRIKGLTLANKELTRFQQIDATTAHSDVGLDSQGREVIVMQNVHSDYIDMIPLSWSSRPVGEDGSYSKTGRVKLVKLNYASDSPFGFNSDVHVSCNYPGYALIGTSTEATGKNNNWLDRKIVLVKLYPTDPKTVYLSNLYGTKGSYWEETHASIAYNGSRVVWATNWGQNVGKEKVFMMELKMPSSWTNKIK